jgi:hypothetical protein
VSWPWRSPEATRRALSDRISNRYDQEERTQRLREVAYRRLLVRLFTTQPERWVVKGGAALLLRLDPNRSSNDIDLAYVQEAGEHAVAVKALGEAASHDAGDFFEFEISAGTFVDVDHPLERAYSVPVVARVGEQEFARFSVDLALPREDLEVEWIEPETTVTGEPATDATPRLAVLAFPSQVADKVCAIYERYGEGQGHSSRARDLADVAMIAGQVDFAGSELTARLRAEEARRLHAGTLTEPLPRALILPRVQRDDWSRRWDRATRGAPLSFEEALEVAAQLVDPVLSGSVDDARWSSAGRAWLELA